MVDRCSNFLPIWTLCSACRASIGITGYSRQVSLMTASVYTSFARSSFVTSRSESPNTSFSLQQKLPVLIWPTKPFENQRRINLFQNLVSLCAFLSCCSAIKIFYSSVFLPRSTSPKLVKRYIYQWDLHQYPTILRYLLVLRCKVGYYYLTTHWCFRKVL